MCCIRGPTTVGGKVLCWVSWRPTGVCQKGSIEVVKQCFMQDNIIASHTCFDGHMDVNC